MTIYFSQCGLVFRLRPGAVLEVYAGGGRWIEWP
jgi:hypothetical protein